MLYIRTDMNHTIATGHLMRCFAIAEAARTLGEETTFLVADENPVSMIQERNFSYIILHSQWDDMESEISRLKEVIRQNKITCMLIDSYMVTPTYLQEVSAMVKVAYLDDLNSFDYPVDSIICYANYWDKFQWTLAAHRYTGLQYVPLRSEFYDVGLKHISPVAEKLLLITGGTDNYQVIEQALEKLQLSRFSRIDVICGLYYTRYEEVCDKYKYLKNVYFHYAVSNIVDYMKQADIVISAGGTSLYELCAIGVPSISYAMADNQLENVRRFHADNMIAYAGDVRCDDIFVNINALLDEYCPNQALRRERSLRMQQLVDGKGAERIARIFAYNTL